MEKHFFDKVCSKVQYEVCYNGIVEWCGKQNRTFDVINENLIIDEANSLITKIQEELKKPHVS